MCLCGGLWDGVHSKLACSLLCANMLSEINVVHVLNLYLYSMCIYFSWRTARFWVHATWAKVWHCLHAKALPTHLLYYCKLSYIFCGPTTEHTWIWDQIQQVWLWSKL